MPCCRVDKLLDYIKAKTADGYDAFIETLRNHPAVVGGGEKPAVRTPREMALLIVGASLKASQFDYLCKKGAFPGLRSKRSYTEGFRMLEKEMPLISYLKENFPGVCFDPRSYIPRVLEKIVGMLELRELDPIIICRKGDGTPEGAFRKYPLFNESINFVQDPNCQAPLHCHVLAIARCEEAVEAEKLHFETYQRAWEEVKEFKGRRLFQIYVCDGSDWIKKFGMGSFSARHCCPRCAIKRADQNLLPWAEGNEHVKAAVGRLRVYVRPGCEGGCTCTHKDCAKNLISRLHDEFPAADHGGVSAEDMKHRLHTEIGDFAQENLIGQVRSPQLIAEKLDWLEQFYYDVFHCDKNHFVNMLWSITVDMYGLLGLSDELSHELSRTHNLGNLNVRQSEKCIEDIRGKGEIREKHSDITGGDRRRLTMERIKISDEVQKLIPSDFASTQTGTYAVLAPLVRALSQADASATTVRDVGACFSVLHRLWTLFDEAAALRNTISKRGDFSVEHQKLVQAFFDIAVAEVGSDLLENLTEGMSYIKWPDHYMACHLSDDMKRFADFSGGIPFGRLSNQVSEHMNHVLKVLLAEHSNDRVSVCNIHMSKFFQILRWLGVERFFEKELAVAALRNTLPCQYCTNQGHAAETINHHRRSSKKCPHHIPKVRKTAAELADLPDHENPLRALLCSSSSGSDTEEEEGGIEEEGAVLDYLVELPETAA